MADSNQISLYGGDLKIKVSLQDANMEFYILAQQFIHYIRSEAFSSIGRPSVGLYIPNAELKFLVAGTGRFLKLIQDSKVRIEITLIKSLTLKKILIFTKPQTLIMSLMEQI